MIIKSENISDDDDSPGNQSLTTKDLQAGADPGNTSRKILLLVEEEVIKIIYLN